MALSPKESGELIARNSEDVTVLVDGVKDFAKQLYEELKAGNLRTDLITENETYPKNLTDEGITDWVFAIDTLNFCFWTPGSDKWEVTWNGKKYTGYFALCAAVARAIDNGIDVTSPKVYSSLTLEDVRNILKGDTAKEVLLLKERHECWQQTGKLLIEKYDGSFSNVIKRAKNSAQELVNMVVKDFPCYNDVAQYKGKTVSFHKRAQILVADLWTMFKGKGYGLFNDIESVTMFADYRVPQVLVYFGTMKYTNKLLALLKTNTILESGSREEIEIRGCSIYVVEELKKEIDALQKASGTHYECNSILIDNYLWIYRRQNNEKLDHIPFHKVISVFY